MAGEARGSLPPRCAGRRAALVATYPAPGAREAGAARRGGAPRAVAGPGAGRRSAGGVGGRPVRALGAVPPPARGRRQPRDCREGAARSARVAGGFA